MTDDRDSNEEHRHSVEGVSSASGTSRRRRQTDVLGTSHATALTGNSDGVSQTFVRREEVDGEGRRQDDLATTYQVDHNEKQVVFPSNC